MGLKASSSLLCLTILFGVSSIVSAVNITRALEKYPEFSTMIELFAKTELTPIINKRQTITVLALSNDAIGSISGRPEEELKNVLMNHVVLDYFDELKLKALKDRSTLLTTLYQSTGLGQQQNGFLNCTKTNGKIYFGSGVKGAPQTAEYITTVFRNPYNLSVIQISMPIVAPGLGSPVNVPPPPPMSSPPSPSPKKAATTPAPGPSEEEDYADSPPGAAPEAAPASAPSEDGSPAPAPGNAGKKKMAAADEVEPPTSASNTGLSFGAVLVLGFLVSFVGF
ncbi:Fasciclin-like arabinogalactan protein 3 [Raphanus sativus]|uniref:Fasciclin-like arabinogalactan protein 3 n=1 Tax=Raphanus sativus TaxID=3726 RepID=A0A6J0LFI5_RAPSA|nr:fasciclin-like arabinogalactan protein 3 [Raphanus sativus]KAJ4873286.1 Fasciclin-like arabinogalactan protein 3 [Raphanus sativus]